MLKREKKRLSSMRMVHLTLLSFLLLTIAFLIILQIYLEGLKRSFIQVGGWS